MNDFFQWIINNFLTNPVQWLALLLSVFNFIVLMLNKKEEKIKLHISQINEAYYFSYLYYEKYDCLFLEVSINNSSKSDTTISNILLSDSYGNTYHPTTLNHATSDFYDCGKLLLNDKINDTDFVYDIKNCNILNNTRIKSYGSIKGYLYFECVSIDSLRCDKERFKLTVETPTKTFSEYVTVCCLPENIAPQIPVKS